MTHVYGSEFFDYIDSGARSSARRLIGVAQPLLHATSVLDLGCGRGAWLAEWRAAGVADVLGVDGDYVDQSKLLIPKDQFKSTDLCKPFGIDRRFDLAQCLEVGEHLPLTASRTLVASLTGASDRVLFSAAVPGQGGEYHINEQPLAFWQSLFAERGYRAFDFVRPKLQHDVNVEPWYRFNAILYANDRGAAGLPEDVLACAVRGGVCLAEGGDFAWQLRRRVVSLLPRDIVTRIAQVRARVIATRNH